MGTRTYIFDDKRMDFNFSAFKRVFDTYRRAKKIAGSKLEEEIAEKLKVATETVHGWHYEKNAPSDIEYVEKLAVALDLNDCSLLLTENNGGYNMNKLTDRQMSAAKRIYDICIWFLDEFDHTDGFNDLWLDFKERGAVDPELAINDHVEKLLRKVNLLIDQEYFDLRGCEVYNVLCEFVSEDLQNTYSGKLSYAYRFEADSEANPSVSQDYDKAMIRLNSIIDQYT